MIRVRGQIGQWPVDLTIEMGAEEWQALAASVRVEKNENAEKTEKPAEADLSQALALLDSPIEGPELLAKLSVLAGSSAEAKRWLVRLRHSDQVHISRQGTVQLWQRKAFEG